MSNENVEVVRRIWDHWAAGAASGDPASLEAPWNEGLLSSDSTFTPLQDVAGVSGRTYVGLEGLRDFVRAWTREWADWRIELEEAIDGGDDRVFAIIHQSATGKRSGASVSLRYWMVLTFENGQVVDRRDFGSRDAALEAAGVQEP